MLLTADENGFDGKCAIPPHEWFDRRRFKSDEEHEQYLDMHLIPKNPELWKLENFEAFIEARKQLIQDKFSYMLRTAQGDHV
ncbi:hypothetical protein FQZ97_1221530 [compost metagenome]